MSEYGQIEQQLQISSHQSNHNKQTIQHIKYHNNYEEIESQNREQLQKSSHHQHSKIQNIIKSNNNEPLFKLVLPQQQKIRLPSRGNTLDQKEKRIKITLKNEDPQQYSPIKSTNLLIYDLQEEDGQKLAEVNEIQKIEDQDLHEKQIKQNEFMNMNYEIKEEKRQKKSKIIQSIKFKKQIPQQKQEKRLFQVKKQIIQPQPFQQILQNHSSTELFARPTTSHRQNKEKSFNQFLNTRNILDTKYAQIKKGILLEHTEQQQDNFTKIDEFLPKVDSGLQITNINSLQSLQQSSSRDILGYPSSTNFSLKAKSKLQSLQPYKDKSKLSSINVLKEKVQPKPLQEIQKVKMINLFGSLLIRSDDIENVGQFVTKAIPYAKKLQCILRRNKNTCKRIFLDYDLLTKDGKLLLSCKKISFKLYSTYHISLANGQYDQRSQYFLAKVEGNFVGSIFNLYSSKCNENGQRQMLGTIFYNDEWSCCKQTYKKIQIYLKNEDYRYNQLEGYSSSSPKNLKDLYEMPRNRKKIIRKLVSKQPTYSQSRKAFTMNFHGKSKMPSIKNMIILNKKRMAEQTLLLAKIDVDQFALDICYPFSPMVALGLVITGFDFKLASQ